MNRISRLASCPMSRITIETPIGAPVVLVADDDIRRGVTTARPYRDPATGVVLAVPVRALGSLAEHSEIWPEERTFVDATAQELERLLTERAGRLEVWATPGQGFQACLQISGGHVRFGAVKPTYWEAIQHVVTSMLDEKRVAGEITNCVMPEDRVFWGDEVGRVHDVVENTVMVQFPTWPCLVKLPLDCLKSGASATDWVYVPPRRGRGA